MILFKGEIYKDKKQDELIDALYLEALKTMQKDFLDPNIVINACDKLYQRVINHEFDDIILPLLSSFDISYSYFLESAKNFSKDGLLTKIKIELGENYLSLLPLLSGTKRKYCPLGILFHVAAGNVDALPAYSVIEGLLAGNINILKLPSGDSGISIKLLSELINVEPVLKDYIYVFDVPSTEITTIKRLASISNGIVVWGGDFALKAAREFAPINSKIISWGHKLSFAYSTLDTPDILLEELAKHICQTNQVLCSSVQGIFVDTNNEKEAKAFAKRFFNILCQVSKNTPFDIGMAGRNTINLYVEKMDNQALFALNNNGVSVVYKDDKELELSYMFRNVWIKRLPREEIISLHKNKSYLQSVALCCLDKDRNELSNMLSKVGVTRITKSNSSRLYLGESHDGIYPLKEYSKIVEFD